MGYDWETPGLKGAAIRVVQHLDRDGDGAVSEKEAPGTRALDKGGKPGVEAAELQAWMESTDAYDQVRALDHSSWSWLDDPKELASAETDVEGWKKATIVTGVIAAVLAILGLILALTGFGAPAAVALFLGGMSGVACPIAGAEFSDAKTHLAEVEAKIADHRAVIAAQLARAAEASASPAAVATTNPAVSLPPRSSAGVSLRTTARS